jgi:4a-hydroxytetrahydrobiopterin dehydratase
MKCRSSLRVPSTISSRCSVARVRAEQSKWVEDGGRLEREFVFADFSEAFAFITRVALIAEQSGHHPDWSNSWNRVTISLTTHDAGAVVTDADREVAAAIDLLVD